jgi:hypothetical protein
MAELRVDDIENRRNQMIQSVSVCRWQNEQDGGVHEAFFCAHECGFRKLSRDGISIAREMENGSIRFRNVVNFSLQDPGKV